MQEKKKQILKIVAWAKYFEQQTDTADIEERLVNQGQILGAGISRIYLSYQTN